MEHTSEDNALGALVNDPLTLSLSSIEDDTRNLDKKFLYEMSYFLYSGNYLKFKNRIKYTFRIVDMHKNLVSNDLHVKYFNELKTIFERNSHLFKFMSKQLTFKPLNNFGIQRRNIGDIFVKQSDVNFLSGTLTPFRILALDINKKHNSYKQRSVYSLILPYTKSLFFNSLYVVVNDLKNITIFVIYKKQRHYVKSYILGFKLIFKNKTRAKRRRKHDKYFNYIMKLGIKTITPTYSNLLKYNNRIIKIKNIYKRLSYAKK